MLCHASSGYCDLWRPCKSSSLSVSKAAPFQILSPILASFRAGATNRTWNMMTWKPTQLMGRTLIGYLHEETCLNGKYMERMWKNMEKDQAPQTTCSLIFHVFTSLSLFTPLAEAIVLFPMAVRCLLQLHPSHLDGTLQGRGIFHKFNWGPGQFAAKFNALLWHQPLKLHLFPKYKNWWLQF